MSPIPKKRALEACYGCIRKDESICIRGDIEASKGDIKNPPECLIYQFINISNKFPMEIEVGNKNPNNSNFLLSKKKAQNKEAQGKKPEKKKEKPDSHDGSTFSVDNGSTSGVKSLLKNTDKKQDAEGKETKRSGKKPDSRDGSTFYNKMTEKVDNGSTFSVDNVDNGSTSGVKSLLKNTDKKQDAEGKETKRSGKKPDSHDGSTFSVDNGSTLGINGSTLGVRGALKEGKIPDLTIIEKEILILIKKGITTRKKLAAAHRSGVKCIDKHITKLRKKGYIDKNNQLNINSSIFEGTLLPSEETCTSSGTITPKQPPAVRPEGGAVQENLLHPVRVHAQQWRIEILWKDERYKNKVGTTSYDDGNAIYCGRGVVEIYSIQSFIAEEVDAAMKKSMDYWTLYFHRLEHDLNIILVKNRAQNIKLVKWEWAEVGNELATHCEETGEKIRVQATEDGKVWLVIDNSFNLRELETQHPQTAKEDMRDTVVPFFNDMRDNKPPKLSEVMDVINKIVFINEETASGLNAVAIYLKSQLPKEPGQSTEDKKKTSKYEENGMYG